MSECIFCQIINKEKTADIIFENERIIVFRDIYPIAPVHFLIIPKKHIPSVNHLEDSDKELVGELFLVARQVVKNEKIAASGYRLIFNTGKDAGQAVDHLHLHLIGGKKLS